MSGETWGIYCLLGMATRYCQHLDPLAGEIEVAFPGVVYYELPAIDDLSAIQHIVINKGMRAGIS